MGNNGKFSCYIIGDGALLIACGELIIDSGHDIYGVISSNPLIREWAEDKGIKCVDHGSDYSEFLKQKSFDYLFSIVYLSVIPKEILALPKKMSINFHDALLPEYAGIHATSWAIMNKETKHGITWHEMVSNVDKGNILKQKTVKIEDNETAFSLNVKCYEAGVESFAELLDELAANSYALTFQDLNRRTYYGKYKRPPVGCVLSWKSSAEEMEAIVRALQFGKYQNQLGLAKLAVAEEYIIVDHIRVMRNKSNLKPGTIVDITELSFKVATVSNDIEISSVMSINGAPLPVADCIKKYNLKLGDSLVEMDSETGTRITLLHDEISKYEDYWINKLLHIDPTIFPGLVQVLEDKYSTNYSVVDFAISDEFINYTKKDYSNMLAGYLAAISSFLFKECKKDSIQVSIGYKELSEDLKGVNNLFAVHVPVKLELNDTLAFRDVCDIAREEIESVKKHKTFLHDLIVRSPQLNDNSILLGRTVLPIIIEYVKDFENYSQATLNRQGISFVIPEKGNTCRIVFSEEVLAKEKAAIYSNRLTTFIARVAAMPETPLSKLTTLADDELHRVIYERNNTAVDYPRDKCMHELFKERVKQYPEKIAVLYKDENLTYMELEKRASRLASFLNRTGVRRGSLVGIFIERSLDMLVGLLGVLKAGGTYVPIDPIYPSERILHMIEDADIKMVLTQEKIEHKLPQSNAKTVCLDKDWEEICKDSGKSSSRKYYSYSNKNTGPEDLAYVIFTSGSTGKPKGVEVTHRGLTNFLCSMERCPGFTNEDRILALTTICFDIAGLELYLPLITGGQVEILPTEIARDGFELKEKIENGITTIVQATPATWEMLLEAGWNRKVPIKILCGGEALSAELAQKLLDRSSEVWNVYGPTETTIWSSVSRVNSGEEITVGQPIANTQFYIVDEYLNPVPDGMEGELCIGGDGLAKGYLNRPNLTKEKFVLNPFDTEKKCKIYKTGDSAKYLPDGRVICLGRIDNQVKLRGFRIELGEIESVLEKQPQIKKAVVVVKEDNTGYKSLAAFMVPEKSTIPVAVKKLSEAVKEFLPEYMVPVSYIFIDTLPLTLNLKVDRKILESMPTAQIIEKYGYKEIDNDIDTHKQGDRIKTKIIDCKDEYEDLTEYFEKDLAEIVAEVVKTPKEGIDLGVPMGEYGYDSIRFTVLSKRIKDKYDIVITPAQFYTYTTINKLKEYILNSFKEQIEEYYGKNVNSEHKEQPCEDVPLILETCEITLENEDFEGHFEKDLVEIVAGVVKISKEEIHLGVPMGEYGYDSIRFTVLSKKIKDKYDIVITPAQFYTYTTIHKLTDFVVSKYREQLQRYYVDIAADAKIVSTYSVTDELKGEKNSFISELNQSRVDRDSIRYQREPVAIIGISGIFPQSPDLETFWDNIVNKRDLITEISDDRWNACNYYIKMAEKNNIAYSKWGGFIEDVDKFDAAFFNISPREAERMDPQQRIFLEMAWKAIENAGYKPSDLSGTKTGVYVGAVSSDYWDMMLCTGLEADPYTISGNVNCVIANRVSYLLNLQGASASIDTACSSSLVAIHRAVAAIQNGYCDMAIAGGVNVILNPFMHIALSTNGMLSADGQCKTFDSRANGYVRGEGAGALILKPLSKAIAEGDCIHAVIRGSSENHGGRTNSLTAPNPNAQADLLISAYTAAGIDPSTVNYIEAHGTGTSLGDPIEINGLKMAFEELRKEWGLQSVEKYCGLGSVKTNIGHLEASAGVAGLLKIVLAMQKGILPGMIHFKEKNPYIDLEGSPFYIISENKEWERLTGSTGKIVPRRAGVSSFGFGGSNSHIVLEEYCNPRSSSTVNYHSPNIFVLSAKSEDRLKAYAMDMLVYLEGILEQSKEDGGSVKASFADIMYTLQMGREVMNKRLAIVALDMEELTEKLRQYCAGEKEMSQVFIGATGHETKSIISLLEGSCGEEFLTTVIRQKEYKKLAQLWVSGISIDWKLLYDNPKPRRISLPTYPFAKERFWIPKIENKFTSKRAVQMTAAFIHPLLHKNTSNFSEMRFSSTFTGQESFLNDHIVMGQRIFPEVAYLEMAREAVIQAAGTLTGSQTGVQLKNVVWAQPIAVEEREIQVHIELFPEHNGEITYEIYSQSEDGSAEVVVHNQGSAALLSSTKEVQYLDIKTLQVECSHSILSSTQFYEAFRKTEIIYGTRSQGIEKVYAGSGQVLARLSLPSSLSNTQDQFVLHPSLVGLAVQASLGLMMSCGEDLTFSRPLALQEIEILGNCTFAMWALVRFSNGGKAGNKIPKFDIDLCDDQGKICIQIKGMQMQVNTEQMIAASLELRPQDVVTPKIQEAFEMMTFGEIWQEKALSNRVPVQIKTMVCFLSNPENQQAIVEAIQKLDQRTKVIFISQSTSYQKQSQVTYSLSRSDRKTYEQAFQSIREDYGDVDAMLYLWPIEDPTCIQDYSTIVYMLQSIATVKLKAKRVLLGAQFKNGLERCYLDSWIGFERSLGLVLPNTEVAVIYQEACEQNQGIVMKDWLDKFWTEFQTNKVQSVLYHEGKRHVYQIQPTTIQAGNSLLKAGGTYLITGGCGGLGLLFAKHFAKTQPVNLILTGRSPMDEKKQTIIKKLEELGSQVEYMQADVSNVISMKAVLTRAKEHFGEIHGVIHAAGLADKQNIFAKDMQSFEQILEPKIKGTIVLDEVLQEEALHFICYFSSSAAILGDFGSCDYAIGNRFQMAYAHYRNEEQRQGKRHGKTIVINWPLWKDGGMGVGEEENNKMYLKSSGQRYLEAEEGVSMFDRLLVQNNIQHLVLVGERSRVYRFLRLMQEQPSTTSPITSSFSGKGRRVEMKGLSLEQCLEWDLKEHSSKILKISREKLDKEENLAEFGFDSISLAQFANQLTNHYGIEITPALFFGYSTIEKLAQYFLAEYQEPMQLFYQETIVVPELARGFSVATLTSKRQEFQNTRIAMANTPQSMQEPIAIIGMSGRFPQARNIDEMWEILAEGKDVVQELFEDRFSNKVLGKSKYKYGCIPGVGEFDPLFFEISPREAETMDPRQRLLLQESWKALEDAGYGSAQIKTSNIGMFVGVEEGDYRLIVKEKSSITSNHNAILSARLAYFLNLRGPNMAINTACSSGLVAVHQACLSLRNQECDTALAAGVNLMLTPEMFEGMNKAGMLSEDGKCFTFDKRANGMVPGEAVAVVVLKRLSQAKADGDPIYAVIKGSGINYDGKTNGITAPSGVAQTELLKSVYDQYKINPEEIEYIVTHGTGTKLGDPIEINALYDAFKGYTKKQGYCALTSTKTNFGHTLAASGLVSLISLVQAFCHETIPESLNCEQENDYIHWAGSPFYVNKVSKSWPEISEKRRIGAVSAFGMSGTNVHMVLQSYCPEKRSGIERPSPYYLLTFSAKTQEALQENIKGMIVVLESKKWQEKDLSQISYTLMEGRQHFNHRCAAVIQDREDAVYILKQMEKKEKVPNLFQGKVPRDFRGQKAIEQYGQDLLKQSQSIKENVKKHQETLYALADLYCQGYELSWELLYGDTKPCRIHLPTYPFAKEHFWVSDCELQSADSSAAAIATNAVVIHPLLHKNISDFSEQRFSSTFTGQEFFLKDHVVKGQRVLPGVAYLEMARAAVEQAAGSLEEGKTRIRLRNVVWAKPVAVGEESVQVHIGLFPEDNGEISYEIYSQSEAGSGEDVVYSQGTAALFSSTKEVETLDIKALQDESRQNVLSSAQCYDAYRRMGISYGPGHRGIEKVYVGSGQVLAKLTLPSSVSATQEQFVLHPSLMDSALQASIGFMLGTNDLTLALPFALQELEIMRDCTSTMWVLLRYCDGSKGEDLVQKLDIDLCDEQGRICVRMKGFSSRALKGEISSAGSASTIGTLMFQPRWKEQAVIEEETTALGYIQHVVMLCEPNAMMQENIKSNLSGVCCLSLQSKEEDIGERFQNYAVQVFEKVQSILKDKPKGRVLIQIVVSTQQEQQFFYGLSGLLKTAQLENPKLIGQLIGVEPREDVQSIIEKLKENSQNPTDNQIQYKRGKRWIASWSEIEASQEAVSTPWKDQGIYLITGGAGGLGLIFAKEIAQQVNNTTLILTGRSPLNEEKQAKIKELESLGTRIEYQRVDVIDKKAVNRLIQNIREEFGGLHGIIHGAGVIRDNFIIRKSKEEMQEVLAPKVLGLVNLDEASKDLNLDFFVFFSSTTGSLGNSGQVDYAAANAFMDAYAGYRNALVALKQRQGQTLSINWPLWKDGGMHVDEETEKMMMQSLGMIAMQTATGIQALYQGLASREDQVMVMEGDMKRLNALFLEQQNNWKVAKITSTMEGNKVVPVFAEDFLREKATRFFKQLLSTVIKLPAHRIEADAPMENYGIDSIMVMQLTNQLEKTFGSLPKTLFFEYQNIQELTSYFLESYRDKLIELLGIEEKTVAINKIPSDNVDITESVKSDIGIRRRLRFAAPRTQYQEVKKAKGLDIAIIGVSGRYPGATNTQEFWRNLRDGKDCITEIPKERWDHSLYYDEDKNKAGKTYSKWGGFLDGVDQFDPLFFNISPREAEIMDPQERLFLECVFATLEDAGYTREALGQHRAFGLEGNVGVYVGVMYEEYQLYGAQETIQGRPIALAGNPASIANRVSYFCNFHGPSMAIDTMCSSSLTAIHLACQSLERGGCELAIAGGVNVSIHPNKYLMLGQGKFVSSKGRCESFGQGGEGYVPGEGVGAVLLKPLSKAIADGDHIYGIIKGTTINHGGKTNGYTVPNPNAQSGVIGQAFKESGINPRTISYVEAHGTGTSLGDPIEIAGLNKTFQEYTTDKQFCAIGSAKSNIGHCESAAGIAGVTKILLQLKYRQLVPSLHSKVLNPSIDFSNTPFIVQQELAEWKRPVVDGQEFPRRAGISSFGAGGSNSHVLIEEYIPDNQDRVQTLITTHNPVMVVLSAKNEDRLTEQVKRLLFSLQEVRLSETSLVDVAYTLQVGREAMEERLAVIVRSIRELEEKLKGFIEGQDDIENLYRGQVKRNKETLAVFAADEDMAAAIDAWVSKGKFSKLIDLWVKGLNYDWNKLYGDTKPQRISLPTYPFAKEHYWVPNSEIKGVSNSAVPMIATFVHPLLHQNISDFSEQRFISNFTGQEFFIDNISVKGQRVLSAIAFLEMARAAALQAAGSLNKGKNGIRLKNVVWASPVAIGEQGIQVHIGLCPEDNGEIAYEIYSEAEKPDAETQVYSQGSAELFPVTESPPLDIEALRVECCQNTLTSIQIYERLKSAGINYEPEHKGIEKVYVGLGQVLAKLTLPSSVTNTQNQFVLHPSLLDTALQTAIGLITDFGDIRLYLPFALQEIEILYNPTSTMWALIRYSDGSKVKDKLPKLDIELFDEQGKICVRINRMEMQENTERKLLK
jgi:polyketide synthase PksN